MTTTMTRRRIDHTAPWRDKKVPREVIEIMKMIQAYRDKFGRGPSWAVIAAFAGWDVSRDRLRSKMKWLRRYGVTWALNDPGSTRIVRDVKPYLRELMK